MFYIKATNTETGEAVIMAIPVFDNRCAAEIFAAEFKRDFGTDVSRFEVIEGR